MTIDFGSQIVASFLQIPIGILGGTMRSRSYFLAVIVLACTFVSQRALAQSSCRAADAVSARMISSLRKLVTTTDTARIRLRNSLGLVAMDSNQVVLVTNSATCDKAVKGMNSALKTPNLSRSVYVVSIGADYAIKDPGHPAGEWLPIVTLDRTFKYKGNVLD